MGGSSSVTSSRAGRTLLLTALALLAFAANSLLCRLALTRTAIDPATFTAVRIVSGAIALWLLTRRRPLLRSQAGSWGSAGALFAYAIAFSYAYVALSAATGALLLFGAVQATMIGYGRYRGERFHGWQGVGFGLAVAGLLGLLLPGVTAPPLFGASLMLGAGVAWGIYSLRRKGAGDASLTTASNFARAVPAALVVALIALPWMSVDARGLAYALASGALTSGIGYVIWYAVLPSLSATTAATVQLSVPVIAAFGGVVLLGEQPTLRLALASVAILGGVALVVFTSNRS
jgi:drug/metabolite transporter (DMT)-like permease